LKGVVSLCYKIEFNATACTDQHLGGGCSKTEAEIEIFRSWSFQKDIRGWNALAESQMMEIKKSPDQTDRGPRPKVKNRGKLRFTLVKATGLVSNFCCFLFL